jgi:hypothetical protein
MQKIRLELSSVTGPATRRELLLGFSDHTTDAYDYGYDARNTTVGNNDLNLDLDGQNMTMQAYSAITADKVVPLNFSSSGDNSFEVRITELVDLGEDQPIYLRDKLRGTYFNLREEGAVYTFSSEQGVFNDRFEIVFQDESAALSTEEALATGSYIYFRNPTNTLFVKKLESDIGKLSLVNMRGQSVLELTDVPRARLEAGLQFNNIATGTYVVCMRTKTNEVLTKKVLIN